ANTVCAGVPSKGSGSSWKERARIRCARGILRRGAGLLGRNAREYGVRGGSFEGEQVFLEGTPANSVFSGDPSKGSRSPWKERSRTAYSRGILAYSQGNPAKGRAALRRGRALHGRVRRRRRRSPRILPRRADPLRRVRH